MNVAAAAPSVVESGAATRQKPLRVALVGNPNVGKSTLFNGLVGAQADTGHYPGVTVDVTLACGVWSEQRVELVDMPGIYGFGVQSVDERLAWQSLLARRPDVVVAVADATNLARSLYVVFVLLDLGFNVVVALTLLDEAEQRSLDVDAAVLQKELGVPVVETTARAGVGLGELREKAVAASWGEAGVRSVRTTAYSPQTEARLSEIEAVFEAGGSSGPPCSLSGFSARSAAFAVLEGLGPILELEPVATLTAQARCHVPALAEDDSSRVIELVAERHRAARSLAAAATGRRREARGDRWWRFATRPATGIPLLIVVMLGMFATLFLVGGALSTLLTRLWNAGPGPWLSDAVHAIFGAGALGDTILWGINGGIFATLAVGIPYIMVIYLMMAVLEDSGYINAVAFLSDKIMRQFGLQGRAVVPLIAAGGCNVPAIMGVRILRSRRERVIASTLVTLVPCSARTAVIVGAVSLYAGWSWALLVYAVVLTIGVAAGIGLNRLLPGAPSDLVMETFPLRMPSGRQMIRRTWARLKDFVWVAAPIVIAGSLLLGALYESGLVWHLAHPLSPIVEGWLGLPAVAGLALVFAVLRRELALQLLVAFGVVVYGATGDNLGTFMTTDQLVVYAIVSCLYVPCASTIAALARELGWKTTATIAAGTLATALLVGGIAARLLALA